MMKGTQIADQLNNSNSGIIVFTLTDIAFSNLLVGMLNSLTDQQKVALIQFHIIPFVITLSQFQTMNNPIRTHEGNANNGQCSLNVTGAGNQVNISKGVINTTISNTLYSDSQLAVYQINKVMLPLDIFRSAALALAPGLAPSKSKKKAKAAADEPATSSSKDSTDSASGFRSNWINKGN